MPARAYGQMHESHTPDQPLYGTICRSGKEWTITLKEKTTTTGCTITGTISGYGSFPFEKYHDIPVIDFTGESLDRCFEALRIHDTVQKSKLRSGEYPLYDFIEAHRKKGFTIRHGFGDPSWIPAGVTQ
jgi:hypothetical protein